MTHNSNRSLVLFCISLVFFTGCNPFPGRSNVSGIITIDGEPIKIGTIAFQPENADPNVAVQGAQVQITNGKYAIEDGLGLLAGNYRVRISAQIYIDTRTGKVIEGDVELTPYKTVDLVPPQYNEKSEIIFTVEAKGGDKTFDLDIKSK